MPPSSVRLLENPTCSQALSLQFPCAELIFATHTVNGRCLPRTLRRKIPGEAAGIDFQAVKMPCVDVSSNIYRLERHLRNCQISKRSKLQNWLFVPKMNFARFPCSGIRDNAGLG